MLADFWFFTIEKLPLKFCRAPPGGRHNIYYTSFEPARCDDSKYLWQFGQFHCFRTIYIILYDRIFSVRRPYISNIWGSYSLRRQKSWLRTVHFKSSEVLTQDCIFSAWTLYFTVDPWEIYNYSWKYTYVYFQFFICKSIIFEKRIISNKGLKTFHGSSFGSYFKPESCTCSQNHMILHDRIFNY